MTCIAGLVQNNKVYMIADSLGSSSDFTCASRRDKKIFIKDRYLIGYTSSYRMGQLIQYVMDIPKRHPDTDLMAYMVAHFVPALKETFKNGGFQSNDNGFETGGVFLIATAGRLFTIDSDYQVGENACGYDACGAGKDVALGALYATPKLTPYNRLTLAITAASEFNVGVRGPYYTEVI